MKNLKLLSVLLTMSFVGLINVNAATITTEADLKSCLADTVTRTCEVGADIVVTTADYDFDGTTSGNGNAILIVKGEKTLELGAYKITTTATSSKGLIHVGELTDTTGAKLTINSTTGGIETGNYSPAAIQLGWNSELVINGGNYVGRDFGVTGNGLRNNTKITINGGSIAGNQQNARGNAFGTDPASATIGIYHPQNGTLTINGGTIIGDTGIEMRSGNLYVKGGNIVGTGTSTQKRSSGNGNATYGAGISVAQHVTTNSIKVVISGGEIEGNTGLYEVQTEANSDSSKVTLSVTGGKITGTTDAVNSENYEEFITGGTFKSGTSNTVDTKYLKDCKVDSNGNVVDFETRVYISSYVPTESEIEENKYALYTSVDNEDLAKRIALESAKLTGYIFGKSDSNVYLGLDILNYDEEWGSSSQKELYNSVKSMFGKNGVVLSLAGLYGGVSDSTNYSDIDKLTDKVSFNVYLTQELRNVPKGYIRDFYLMRVVDGKLEKISAPTSNDGKTIKVSLDNSELYVLGYQDVTNPNTFDGIVIYASVGTISLISLIVLAIYSKKKLF